CVFVKEVNNPQDYGVAKINDDKVEYIVEKPKDFISNLAVVGLYVYTTDVFDVIRSVKPSTRGELEISAVNDYYAAQGLLQHKIVSGYWSDAGSSIHKYAECCLHGAKKANVSAADVEQ